MSNLPVQFLSVKEAARILRVSEKTLRRWEDRGYLTPLRTTGKHRRYTLNQLKEFKSQKSKIKKQIEVSKFPEFTIHVSKKTQKLEESKTQSNQEKNNIINSFEAEQFHFAPNYVNFAKKAFVGYIWSLVLLLGGYGLFNIALNQKLNAPTNLNQISGEANFQQVLAVTNFADAQFNINIPAVFNSNATFNSEALFNSGLTLNDETVTDLTGTGLTITNGALSTTLGTNITSAELVDNTISEVDLLVSNTANNAQFLSFNSTTGGFTWATPTDTTGSNFFTDGGDTTYLTSTRDNFALGGSTTSAQLYFDTDPGIFYLNKSAAGQWIAFNDGTDTWGLYNYAGSPEGNITANTGTLAMDTLNGTLYVKTDDADATSWLNLATGSSSPWDASGGLVTLGTTTNNVNIGGSTNLGKLAVDGDTDEIQLLIQGNSTQTSNLVVFENSSGTDLLTLNNSGALTFGGGGSGFTTIFQNSGSQTQNNTFTLPVDDGGVNHVLTSDGSGVLSWLSVSGVGGMTSFTLSADGGSDQTITDTNTLEIAGGTNGIDTSASATDTVTLNLDTTEIGTTTFGSGSGITWTFDAGATDPTITFASDLVTVGNGLTVTGTLTANGAFDSNGNVTIADTDIAFDGASTTFTTTGAFTLTPGGAVLLGDGGDTLQINSSDWDVSTTGDFTGVGGITMDGNFSQTGATTLSTGTGAITLNGAVTANTDVDLSLASTENLTITSGAPGADLTVISGGTSVTDGVDGLQISFGSSNVSGNVVDITPSFAGGATDALSYYVIDIDAFSPTNAAGTDLVRGINIGNLTDPGATITSSALRIGTGWDSILDYNGTTVINGSGQIVSTQINGTLFTAASDASSSTIIQADTLTLAGGTNGIDTTNTGDSFTINLDTTEIGTTTFGSGSGITWTFDASGGTDTTVAFGNNTQTLTAGTITLAGNVDATNGIDVTGANLTVGGSQLTVDVSNGNITSAGDIAINGGDITSSGDITINPTGGDVFFTNGVTFNVGGNATDVAYNAIGDSTSGASQVDSDDDLYIEGNLEVDGSIYGGGIDITTFVCPDCIDFDDMEDTLDLDAALTLNQGSNSWIQNFTGTTTTGLTYNANSLTTGSAINITTSSNPASAGPISINQINATTTNTTTATTLAVLDIGFTNNPSVASNTEYIVQIQNESTSNTTDNITTALLRLDNADTSSAGSTVVTNGLLITNSGDIAGGIVNAINIDDTDVTTDIVLQNDETIDNNTDGTVTITAPTTSLSGDLAINGGNITSALTLDSTLTVTGTTILNEGLSVTPAGTNDITFNVDSDSLFTLDSSVANGDNIIISPNNTGTGSSFTATITTSNLTADRSINFPDAAGDVCLSSGNCAGGAGGSKWTDSGSTVYLTDTGDELVLGGSSPLSSSKFSIDGDDDQIQLIIQGNSSQTAGLLVIENSSGTDFLVVEDLGGVTFSPSSTDDVTITTDSDSTIVITGLSSASGTALCLDGSNNVVTCSAGSGSSTLQSAYDADTNGSDTLITLSANDDSVIFRNPASSGTDSAFTFEVENLATGLTTANFKNLFSSSSGTVNTTSSSLTNYAGYFSNTTTESAGANTLTNVALYATASGGDANYSGIFESGNFGIGDTTPTSLFTVGATDAFQIDSSGNIVAIGGAAHSISNSTGALVINSATTGTLSIGSDSSNETLNFGTGAAVKTTIVGSTNTTSSTTIQSGTGDITFASQDDFFFTPIDGSEIDITAAASTTTEGVLDLNIDSSVTGGFEIINSGLTVNNGASAGDDFSAELITLTANDADADLFGIQITASATANAAAGSYEALIRLDNAENTIAAVTDGILISSSSSTDQDITDGIDVSHANIVNAINIGANVLLGTTSDINLSNFDVTGSSGDITTAGDIAVNGGDITASGDLTITPAGGDVFLGNAVTLNIGGNATDVAYNIIGDNNTNASASMTSDDDLYIEGFLEVDSGVNFSPDSTNDVTIATDSDSTLIISGLSSGTGNALCVDGSANVVTCTVGSGGIAGSGTAGQIAVFDGTGTITSESSGFGWDTSNNIFSITATSSTATAGVMDLEFASAADGFEGINIDFQVDDDAASETLIGQYLNVDDNATTANDTVYGLYLDNENSGDSDADKSAASLLVIDNSDTNDVVADGILFISAGGGFTDFIDTPSSVFKVDGSGNIAGVALSLTGNITDSDSAVTINDDLTITTGTTISASSITTLNCTDCIDFDDITDTLNMDADTSISFDATEALTLSASGTTETSGVLGITVTSAAANAEAVNLSFTVNDDNDDTTESFSGFNITATQNSDDTTNDDNLYGIVIQNLGGTAASGNEYAIYQAGTSWDYGLYIEDAAHFNTTLTISGTLTTNGQVDLGDNGDTVAINSSDWDIDATGAITGVSLDANGSGNSISNIENADLANDTLDWDKFIDSSSLDTDLAIAAGTGEEITLNKSYTNNTGENAFVLNLTASDTGAGTSSQYGLYIDNIASTEGADALIALNNADADDAVGAGILFTAGGAGTDFTVGIDFSSANLTREIVLENGEAIIGQVADTITFEDDDGTDYATLTQTALTVTGDLAITGGNVTTAVTFDSTATVTGTLTANGQVDLGDNGDTVSINSNDWDISTTGAITGVSLDANGSGNSISNIDFDNILASPAVDEATDINLGSNQLSIDLDSTGDFVIRDVATAMVTFNENNSGQVVLADGVLLDLSAILHDDTTIQGFRLPQNTALTNPASGEGFLAWDTDDNQIKVYDGSSWSNISGASTTLQQAYSADADGSDTLITLDATDGSLIIKPIAGTNFQVAQVTSAPTVDIMAITNSGLGTTTNGVDGLSLTFVTGDGTDPTNNGINLALTSGGTAATDILNGINFALTGTSGTERGINFSDNNFDTDINATTDLTLGIGGTNEIILNATDLSPSTSDGTALGTGSLMWSDLFLASLSVINFNNGDVTITHGADLLTIAGGGVTTSGTLTADGTFDANGTITLGDGGDSVTVDGTSLTLQTTGAGSDITLNAVDQIILTDFTTCTSLETIANVLTCGTDADSGGTTTLQQAYSNDADGSDTLITLDATDGSLIIKPIAGTNFQVAQVTSAPTVDIMAITNSGLGTTTNGVDGLSLTFVTGNGTDPTNNAINVALTSGGTAATDILNAINLSIASTSGGTDRGINIADNSFDTDINATTDLTLGIGGTNEITLTGTNLSPSTAEGNSLGSSSLEWEQLFVGDDNGISFGLDQDWTMVYDEATDDRLELTTAGTTGALVQSATATGSVLNLVGNSISTGSVLQIDSSSTSLTTADDGFLGYFSWAPGSTTTASGDLFRINIGSNGNVTNIFNVTDNGSSLFSVSESQITSAIPHSFTAAGDVNIAYDLVFTNQTSSNINSYGPLTITAGESFESNNLTLQVYNSGQVVVASASGQLKMNVEGWIETNLNHATSSTEAVCGTSTAETAYDTILDDCTTNVNADYAEIYPTEEDVDYGDIVVLGPNKVTAQHNAVNSSGEVISLGNFEISKLTKSTNPYQESAIGIVSNNWSDFSSTGGSSVPQSQHPMPVALSGRVPVKVSQNSENISVGDFVTTSSEPGKAMKATAAGRVVGKAIESWASGTNQETVMVFVNNVYYSPTPENALTRQEIEEMLRVAEQNQDLLNQSSEWEELTVSNLYVTNQAVFNSLSLSDSLVLGNDLVIQNNNIDTLTNPLNIQGSGTQPLNFMAGKVTIDTSGNMVITGDLKVLGTVDAGKVSVSNQVAGASVIPAGYFEITILNENIKPDSLIFVTPTSSVKYAIYVKSQAEGTAVIGFDEPEVPTEVDTKFNWWIVGVSQ